MSNSNRDIKIKRINFGKYLFKTYSRVYSVREIQLSSFDAIDEVRRPTTEW